MTGQLKSTLERHAAALEPLDLDLDAIAAAGRGRVRRRRAVVGGVAAAAVLATTASLSSVVSDRVSSDGGFATAGSGRLLYAVGDVIHSGDATIHADRLVYGVVPTATGVVYVDSDLRVFDVDPSGSHQIGRLAQADFALVADTAGETVAWRGSAGLDVYRVSTDKLTTVPLEAPPEGQQIPSIRTVSDGTVWFWDARGNMIYDSVSGRLQHLADLQEPNQVQDVAGDRMLAAAIGPSGAYGAAVLRMPVTVPFQPQTTEALDGDLSPDGSHWYSTGAGHTDTFEVFDSATGQARVPDTGGGIVEPYAWLDDDTIVAWRLPEVPDRASKPVTLLTCRVSTNTCSVAARDIGVFGRIALDGHPIG